MVFSPSLDRKLMAVEVKTARGLEAPIPKPLFQTRIAGSTLSVSGSSRYVASANGQRFLVNSLPEAVTSAHVAMRRISRSTTPISTSA